MWPEARKVTPNSAAVANYMQQLPQAVYCVLYTILKGCMRVRDCREFLSTVKVSVTGDACRDFFGRLYCIISNVGLKVSW